MADRDMPSLKPEAERREAADSTLPRKVTPPGPRALERNIASAACGFVARDPTVRSIVRQVETAAARKMPVLIRGETGTGKEQLARHAHAASGRAGAFVPVNCAALPDSLIEAELFGYAEGAFTGAKKGGAAGLFREADGGTLFLDEIGDMTPATQTKILRVLQSGTFERVGGNQPLKVDVRIIAATNKPLEQAVAARQFREDLFYRLNVVRIHIPPLRERREDIRLLVNYFLAKFAKDQPGPPRSVAPGVLKALEKYHWPGNVRELENIVQRALVMSKGEAILLTDLPAEISGQSPSGTSSPMPMPVGEGGAGEVTSLARQLFQWARREPKMKIIPAVERELVIQALKETEGNQVHAAKLLGITRATLRKRVEKFGIQRELNIK
jgi:two-component system nitrogen regulation response regulator GlnG